MQNKAFVVKPVMEIEKDHDSSRLIEDLSDIQVPDDAILDGSIQRFNLDTPGGKIVEIWVFRKVGRDRNHLKGPIYSNITASTVTKYPQNRNNSIVYQPDFNNNGGTIESDQEERIDGDEATIHFDVSENLS